MGRDALDYQPAATKSETPPLVEHSGFMDGLKSLGSKAGDVIHKGYVKGQELANSETAQKAKAQVVETTHKVMASPVTHQVVNEATRTGKQLAQSNVDNVHGVIDAGKRGDIRGVIQHAAPIAGEVALGPGGVALNIARHKAAEVAINQAPASQRGNLQRVAELSGHLSIPSLTASGLARAVVQDQVHSVKRSATDAALGSNAPAAHQQYAETRPRQTEQASAAPATTSDFIKNLRAKLQKEQTGSSDVKHE